MNNQTFVANFRDVGASINQLAGNTHLREGLLTRGGSFDLDPDPQQIGSPRTVLNLRRGRDPALPGTTILHNPAPDSLDVYLVTRGSNRKWILAALSAILDSDPPFPLYVHCAAGKDRTGIIVAAILTSLGIPPSLIMADYMLSTGQLSPSLFKTALQDLADPGYFRRLNLAPIAEALLAK